MNQLNCRQYHRNSIYHKRKQFSGNRSIFHEKSVCFANIPCYLSIDVSFPSFFPPADFCLYCNFFYTLQYFLSQEIDSDTTRIWRCVNYFFQLPFITQRQFWSLEVFVSYVFIACLSRDFCLSMSDYYECLHDHDRYHQTLHLFWF